MESKFQMAGAETLLLLGYTEDACSWENKNFHLKL